MTQRKLIALLAAAMTAAACVRETRAPTVNERDRVLDRAFAAARQDPVQAADLFAAAGPGAALEWARLDVWADCLDRSGAPADAWRRFLEDDPPPVLAARARVALARALAAETLPGDLLNEPLLLPAGLQPEVDELLLDSEDQSVRLQAAGRLAVAAPQRLRNADRELERRVVKDLSPQQLLGRSRAWRYAGAPASAAAELRSLRFDGEEEILRRRELARAELAAGSPRRALAALPSGGGAEDHELRALALRKRAWQLFPDRRARRAFEDCLAAADSALAAQPDPQLLPEILELQLECGTEAAKLETAIAAWRRLETLGWSDPRREWLGRRLGVSAALDGMAGAADEIGRCLPQQRRCLRYWASVNADARDETFADLAAAEVADLYGQWSRQALGLDAPATIGLRPSEHIGSPPASVRRLLDAGLGGEALDEWRRFRRQRGALPDEALAAAELASVRGVPNEAVRWLLAAYPQLGTIDMATAPANAVQAYLPLRWPDELVSAAREFGLEPWLVAAIARQESVFHATARSPRGAIGVLQLIPETARGHARALGLERTPDLEDPATNLRLGARELATLIRRFGAVEPALAAYNGGLTRTRAWWKRWPDRHRFTEEVPVPETYNYIRRVLYLSEAYRLVYREQWRAAW